jgi:hypothetical protein
MNARQKYFSASLLATAALLGASPASAQVALGAASRFDVLAGTAITCTAGSIVAGDVGISPGSAFTNTGCTITGATPPATNAAAAQAQTALSSAYAALQSRNCIAKPGNLSGENLAPGTYCLDASAKAGTLTLTGNANDVWIFRVAGALTGTNFTVVMAGGQPCNVFWAPSAATTMTTSAFKGNILAGDAIGGSVTLTGGTLAGRVLAKVAVTMTGTSVIGCGALAGPGAGAGGQVCNDKDRDGKGKDDDDRDDEDKEHGKKHGDDKDRAKTPSPYYRK